MSYSPSNKALERKEGNREQNKGPIIWDECDLLHHLDIQVSGARWDPCKANEGAHRSAHQTSFSHLRAVLANERSPSLLEATQHDSHLQEGLEAGSEELTTGLSTSVLGKVLM